MNTWAHADTTQQSRIYNVRWLVVPSLHSLGLWQEIKLLSQANFREFIVFIVTMAVVGLFFVCVLLLCTQLSSLATCCMSGSFVRLLFLSLSLSYCVFRRCKWIVCVLWHGKSVNVYEVTFRYNISIHSYCVCEGGGSSEYTEENGQPEGFQNGNLARQLII